MYTLQWFELVSRRGRDLQQHFTAVGSWGFCLGLMNWPITYQYSCTPVLTIVNMPLHTPTIRAKGELHKRASAISTYQASLELLPWGSTITFFACRKPLPSKPLWRQHCWLYYGGGCQLQTAGFHYGRIRAMRMPAKMLHLFNGNMWEALFEQFSTPASGLKTACLLPVGGASYCYFFFDQRQTQIWRHLVLFESLSHGLTVVLIF